MTKDTHPYPAVPDIFKTFPDGAPSHHVGCGTTQGAAIPATGREGRQPMPAIDGGTPPP
jgi:hypothetical protein